MNEQENQNKKVEENKKRKNIYRIIAIVLTIVILSLVLENIIKFFWRDNRYDKV